jgi:SOS-response transcriptional repressor LexA
MSTTLVSTHQAEYWIVDVCLPGQAAESAGVIVRDPSTGEFRVRFRRDWEEFAGDEAEVLELLAAEFADRLGEPDGGVAWIAACEQSLSHTLRITDRQTTLSADLDKTVSQLYHRHVTPRVLRGRTHVRFYSARIAGGALLANPEIDEDPDQVPWVEVPEGMRITEDSFLCRVVGRSMEPEIPDGAVCLFRRFGGGTRNNRKVLVKRRSGPDSEFTIKVYRSEWEQTEDGRRQKSIRLEPLNPEFEAWFLDEDADAYQILGEFLAVFPEDPEQS